MRADLKSSLIALILGINPVLFAGERMPLYRVLESKGDTKLRTYFSAAWRPLNKGALLYGNDMITVGEESQLRVERLSQGDLAEGQSVITITQPFITRVSPQLVREVNHLNVSNELLLLGATLKTQSAVSGQKSALDFRDAWNKLTALPGSGRVNPFAGTPGNGKGTDDREGTVRMSQGAKPMLIYAPQVNEAVFRDLIPKTIFLSWARPDAYKGMFSLYIWRQENPRPAMPVAETPLNFHHHPIMDLGRYKFQVATLDQSWQSAVQTFEVVDPATRPEGKTLTRVAYAIDLVFPPPDYVKVRGAGPIAFSWSLPSDVIRKQTSVEFLRNGQNVEVIPAAATSLVRDIPEGATRWRVVSVQKVGRVSAKVVSEWREVRVVNLTMGKDGSLLKALTDAKISGNVEVDATMLEE